MNSLLPPRSAPVLLQRLLVALIPLGGTVTSHAGLVLDTGDHILFAGRPGQTLNLELENPTAFPISFGGLDLILEIVDPLHPDAEPARLPALTAVNLSVDTVYSGHPHTVFADPGNDTRLQFLTVSLSESRATTPEISAHGRATVATLTFDTTGLVSGAFDLRLTGTSLGNTTLYDPFGLVAGEFAALNGKLHLQAVPEPRPTAAVCAMGLLALALWRRRNRPTS